MNHIRFLLILSIPVIFSTTALGKHIYKEREYQECWCSGAGGVTEYVLPDRTRVDCLTDDYAIEFDFADHWAESIGQALYYSMMTGRKPGIVLILEDQEKGERYLKRLRTVADELDIKVWTITPSSIME